MGRPNAQVRDLSKASAPERASGSLGCMLHRIAVAACLLLVGAGCREKVPNTGAVRVAVTWSDYTPGCLRITANDAEGAGESVRTFSRDELSDKEGELVAAVFRGEGWSDSVRLEVASFEVSCSAGEFPLESRGSPVLFVGSDAGVAEFSVALLAADRDRDGFPGRSATVTGSDCDDSDPARNPGAQESCSTLADLNCDGRAGCDDPSCGACAQPPPCYEAVGVCAQGTCQYTKLAPGAECQHPSGPGRCTDGAQCVSEAEFCLDCSREGCAGRACTDGNGCTENDVCTAGGTCEGAPKVCTPGLCEVAQCVDGACVTTADVGASCNAPACLANATCQADRTCSGQNLCTNAPACHQPVGMCGGDGLCTYALNPGGTCDDGVACTHTDQCTADGGCAGTAYTCTPQGPCQATSTCAGDGGCTVTANLGVPCTITGMGAGFCNPVAQCVPPLRGSAFPYAPSNFNQAHFMPGPALTISSTCSAVFDAAATGATAGTFTSSCVQNPQAGVATTLADGRTAWVIPVERFEIEEGGQLILRNGDRPVIFAVYGNVFIRGPLLANSRLGNRSGPGATWTGCGTGAGGPGAANGSRGGGGGGGGFGQGGADGGTGRSMNATPSPGGSPGTSVAAALEPLRAGCAGGAGGTANGGAGGLGGGALQLSAAGHLLVAANVTVSGAGGGGGVSNSAGGGGGGSGGMLVLEGDTVELVGDAALTANGGGGGGGSENGLADAGTDGYFTVGSATPGGAGQTAKTGAGGNGGSGTTLPNPGGTGEHGGGGGGGGTGVIFVRGHQTAAGSCVKGAGVTSPVPVYLGGCL